MACAASPAGLALAVFRMPLRAYRHDAGWLLGHTFLEFVHTGRKTGQRYETVAMVLRYDPDAREAVICAGWGPDTDWVRNLGAGPAAQVRLGRESFIPQHRFLSDEEAFDVAVQFRREHPRRMRLISTIWAGETCVTTPRSAASSVPTRSSRSARRPARPDRSMPPKGTCSSIGRPRAGPTVREEGWILGATDTLAARMRALATRKALTATRALRDSAEGHARQCVFGASNAAHPATGSRRQDQVGPAEARRAG